MSWYLNDNDKLTNDNLPEAIVSDLITNDDSGSPYYGYPALFWTLDSNNILTENKPTATPPLIPQIGAIVDEETGRNDNEMLTPPYPASFWYYDEDKQRLSMLLFPDAPGGAFTGCTRLAYISIPESVKEIGYRAFAETALTKVRIARDCVYDPTSFPEGCEIWYYDEEPEPVDYGSLISDLKARVAALEENQ